MEKESINDMIKTIDLIEDKHFYIPAYQRGYRWRAKEVENLLNDLHEFDYKADLRIKYCLQPLIIKQNNNLYEVVDGQQRLTTIAILLQVLQITQDKKPFFKLEYETRKNSQDFLENITTSSASAQAEENIDFYHMSHAYRTMIQWLENQENPEDCRKDLTAKIKTGVFFIWYEVPSNTNVIDLFKRVNMGKIPLTNAELIKALFFNQQNFHQESIERDQTEMAMIWERIEHGLADDSFWYFLNNDQQTSTRMDQLFALIAKDFLKNPTKYRDLFADSLEIQTIIKQVKASENSALFSFYLFNEMMESAKKGGNILVFMKQLWQEMENLDALLHSWYDSFAYYHLIGLLIAFDKPLEDLITLGFGQRKSQMVDHLLRKIEQETIVKNFLEDADITYSNTSKKDLRKLLLLFNIATLVMKSEKQARFPFDLYKKYKWDIEHIHACADKTADPDHSLGNLTLLDRGTNRSYQDKPFVEKRAIILECDRNGLFIPVCTKNIFIKAYSASPKDLGDWYGDEVIKAEHNDKANYMQAMQIIVREFFSKKLGESSDGK